MRTMQDISSQSLARTSFTLVMLGIAGTMALALGSIGIYGVISYAVSQRTREIGIRLALGADKAKISRMIIGQGLRLALAGVVAGAVATLVLGRSFYHVLSSPLWSASEQSCDHCCCVLRGHHSRRRRMLFPGMASCISGAHEGPALGVVA